jgi:hypothetical protein
MLVDIKDGDEAMSFSCKVMVLRKQGDKLAAQFSVIDKGIQGVNLSLFLADAPRLESSACPLDRSGPTLSDCATRGNGL